MAAILLFFMGQFALFTYLRPFLEQVTGVDVATLSALLLVVGLASLLGTALIGRVVAASLPLTLAGIPLGRVAAPEDVADAIAFLASDRARHVTGEILNVNGGSVLCG